MSFSAVPHGEVSSRIRHNREDRVPWCRSCCGQGQEGDGGAPRVSPGTVVAGGGCGKTHGHALAEEVPWAGPPGLLLHPRFHRMGFDFVGSHFISLLPLSACSRRPVQLQPLGKAEFKDSFLGKSLGTLEEIKPLNSAQQNSCISLPDPGGFLPVHPPSPRLFLVPISPVLGAGWGRRGLEGEGGGWLGTHQGCSRPSLVLQKEQAEEYEARQRKGFKRSESVEKAQVRCQEPEPLAGGAASAQLPTSCCSPGLPCLDCALHLRRRLRR